MTVLTVNPHTLFLCMFLRMSWVAQIAGVGGISGLSSFAVACLLDRSVPGTESM